LAKDAKCATRKVSIPVLYLAVTALHQARVPSFRMQAIQDFLRQPRTG
jgi:hypothetical protein